MEAEAVCGEVAERVHDTKTSQQTMQHALLINGRAQILCVTLWRIFIHTSVHRTARVRSVHINIALPY
jgi:hypothetical protein